MMESEHSFSGESSSSSETSSSSSDGDEEVMEPLRILGQSLELPQELCEDYGLFKEVFSMKTWESLEDKHKEELIKYLPNFSENDEEEKDKTIKMLFNYETFHFSTPLGNFYDNLKQGNYRPDIAKMRKFLKKARAKQQKHKLKAYYAKLLPEVLISRERLLTAVKLAPPGPPPMLPPLPPKPSSKNNNKPLYLRARQRYFEELSAIRSEVGGEESDDDNYPEGPPPANVRKRKSALHPSSQNCDSNVSGTLGGLESPHSASWDCLKTVLATHRSRRQYRENHPELNTAGITLEDIKQRVALVNGAKKLMFGGSKTESPIQKLKRGPKPGQKQMRQEKQMALKKLKEEQDTVDSNPLLPNIKIKCERVESDSESSSFVDPATSPRLARKSIDMVEVKQEIPDRHDSINNYSDMKLDKIIKQEPPDLAQRMAQAVPIKLEDLEGIDMMSLPVEIADDSGDVPETSTETNDDSLLDGDEALAETTHANFMSLVRALFPARSAHRASKQQLHARCAAVMKSPIAPLNTWYSLSDDWCAELNSALDFLAGDRGPHPDDYVPYLQYIPATQMYQWIGAGRDCDAILGRLCERWLKALDPPQTPKSATARYPTTWTVKSPTSTELAEFRAQERRRFTYASKPFTYVQHGYRSVVGGAARGGGGGGGGGAGAALLAAGRPRAAALPALLRDALARLPNGEGTTLHVVQLLKMSQYLNPCSDEVLLPVVKTMLEKMLTTKRDPIVKYDPKTSIWTYLYRNRTEEDWLKLMSKRGKSTQPSSGNSNATNASTKEQQTLMDLELGGMEEVGDNASDSDVDVDDVTPSSTLSSAQLLMQATQTQPKAAAAPPSKPKGKLTTPSPKPKISVQTKQTPKSTTKNLMAQSVKQANLISQATKQASLQAQAAKQNSVVQAKSPIPPIKTSTPTPKPPQPKPAATPPTTSKPSPTLTPSKPAPTPPKQTYTVPKSVAPPKTHPQNPKSVQSPKPNVQEGKNVSSVVKTSVNAVQPVKSVPVVVTKTLPMVTTPSKSPLIKQRPLQQKTEGVPPVAAIAATHTLTSLPQNVMTPTVIQQVSPLTTLTSQPKIAQGTRSLLIRPPSVQTNVTAVITQTPQIPPAPRRGVVRVLSPATPATGKSLISPRALMPQGTAATKKRPIVSGTTSVTTTQSSTSTTVVSSVPTAVTSTVQTRTVQLADGRTVQLANQTVHLPGGHAVQLSSGHTLQLSSLQLPTHSVRLPSGQTVQLAATPQTVQAVRAVSTAAKNSSPRVQTNLPAVKTSLPTSQHIPVSSVQLAGQTVQIGGQTVQLAGQSVQLTGHTVKLPSGQSVQVASQSVLPSQSVQLPSGQTVQLTGNVQTVQLGQNVLTNQMTSGQSVQLGSQTVQLGSQTVQLAGQTVQLPSGQTIQLSSGQTVQLSSGQTLQLAGQTVQLGNQAQKTLTQVVRTQAPGEKTSQPIVAKLLTNAQGQMVSLEGMLGARGLSSGGAAVGAAVGAGAGGALRARGAVRVLPPGARLARPLLLTSAKPLHNIILQQSDGTAIRMTSASGSAPTQTVVLSNIGAQSVTTSTTSAPVLKLQQVSQLQQVKLPQTFKIQQSTSNASQSSSNVRSVLMDGQQLKLVGGRHVLARLLRPSNPPQ